MKYSNIQKAVFVVRRNRFTAEVEMNGKTVLCHVKNTGRLGELLVPGAQIYVQKSDNSERKTDYDLISVVKDGKLVNVDSFAPNVVSGEYLRAVYPSAKVIPEKKYGNSRFDFYIENGEEKGFVEVKGVTLFRDGRALFPDAPTERGIKHLNELSECVKNGYFAKVFFIIAADSEDGLVFSPNRAVGNEFALALEKAVQNGVEVYAFDCEIGTDFLSVKNHIGVELA